MPTDQNDPSNNPHS